MQHPDARGVLAKLRELETAGPARADCPNDRFWTDFDNPDPPVVMTNMVDRVQESPQPGHSGTATRSRYRRAMESPMLPINQKSGKSPAQKSFQKSCTLADLAGQPQAEQVAAALGAGWYWQDIALRPSLSSLA